jgi:hypothetical protein
LKQKESDALAPGERLKPKAGRAGIMGRAGKRFERKYKNKEIEATGIWTTGSQSGSRL